jgi:hypothetical protein
MHIPVNIEIKSNQSDENKIKNFLMPNKLIYVQDIYVEPTNVVGKVTIRISGIVFDNQDIPIIETDLKSYGDVKINKGSVKILTLDTILSGLVVAVIVAVALFGHSFNAEFYKQVFEQHNNAIILETISIIALSAGAGFGLEILIIYRERRLSSHH